VADSLTLIDMFVRGIAVGAMAVTGFAVWRSGLSRHVQFVAVATCVGITAWLITESATLWAAFDHFYPIKVLAYPNAGLFWLLVVTAFEDRPLSGWTLSPVIVLTATGFLCEAVGSEPRQVLWAARNIFSGLLCLHAALIVARGWAGDLLEDRRRLRGVVLGAGALFGLVNVALAFISRIDPDGLWMEFMAGGPYGGAIFTVVIVAIGAVFLQARPGLFELARRPAGVADGRADAAERLLLGKLNTLVSEGAWRREGLTIGALARELGEPEYRLRRLINQRLGHRNFADFVNGFRIEAAKARLGDPREARTTVAAIAFDLGYGSLGPFNRAFRAATGATPTEWRRQALQASPELQEAV